MKVVLFCGGLGTRLREHSDTIPKPLVNVGYPADHLAPDALLRALRPHGLHPRLGYRGDLIREYFLNYNEAMSNDFTLSKGGTQIELHGRDISTTGASRSSTPACTANIGQRLLRVRKYLEGEEMFLANYADGLSDLPLDEHHRATSAPDGASRASSPCAASQSFHAVHADAGRRRRRRSGRCSDAALWINGGFFVLRQEIFDYIDEGEELVEQPFARLIAQAQARARAPARRASGRRWTRSRTRSPSTAWKRSGKCPWMVWKRCRAKAAG